MPESPIKSAFSPVLTEKSGKEIFSPFEKAMLRSLLLIAVAEPKLSYSFLGIILISFLIFSLRGSVDFICPLLLPTFCNPVAM